MSLPPDPRLDAAVQAYEKALARKRTPAAKRAACIAAIRAYAAWTCTACGVAHRGPLHGCETPKA